MHDKEKSTIFNAGTTQVVSVIMDQNVTMYLFLVSIIEGD